MENIRIKYLHSSKDDIARISLSLYDGVLEWNDIKVKQLSNGEILVTFPNHLDRRWPLKEISYYSLTKQISQNFKKRIEYDVDIYINESGNAKGILNFKNEDLIIKNITFSLSLDKKVKVDIPESDKIFKTLNGLNEEYLLNTLKYEYLVFLKKLEKFNANLIEEYSNKLNSIQNEFGTVTFYFSKNKKILADIETDNSKITNIQVLNDSDGSFKFITKIDQDSIEIEKLTFLIERGLEKSKVISLTEDNILIEEDLKKFGIFSESEFTLKRRAKSDKPLLHYRPNTKIRVEEKTNKNNYNSRQITNEITKKFTIGFPKGMGKFEIDMLTWLNKLKYLTSTMILDLYYAGVITSGGFSITSEKIIDKLRELHNLDLVSLFKYVTEENNITESKSYAIISVPTQASNNLLYQLGIENLKKVDSLALYQNPEITKGILAGNQWFIYFLKNYYDDISFYIIDSSYYMKNNKNYIITIPFFINIGNDYLMAETLRRGPEELESINNNLFKEKLKKYYEIFNEFQEIYNTNLTSDIKTRPILNIVVEDEDHMSEIWDLIKDIVQEDTSQKIWFTYDLNLYNDLSDNKRFFEFDFDKNKFVFVDIKKQLQLS